MLLRTLLGGSTAAVLGCSYVLISASAMQAAMLPTAMKSSPTIQHIDCAVGAHLGPLGACILGSDSAPPPDAPVVVEHRAADVPVAPAEGCSTTSINRTDSNGNSETKTRSNC